MYAKVLLLGFCWLKLVECSDKVKFDDNFVFGIGTSSYQIEGAWNLSGKGESIWDHFTHAVPSPIKDKTNGDIACDSYNRYKEDLDLIVGLGVTVYRFSISWTRILPNGFSNQINQEGVAYYNNLINELLARNITPMVTMYHWDLPQNIQNLGGWTNRNIVDYFEQYARILLETFGDRVKQWTTINEPHLICYMALGTKLGYAPEWNLPGIADYMCYHNILLSHARVWHMYQKDFKKQGGIVGITVVSSAYIPETEEAPDKEIADLAHHLMLGIQTNAIFSKSGDYPAKVKEVIAQRSKAQGFNTSRLPEFTPEEIQQIKQSSDFLGLNYYYAEKIGRSSKRNSSQVPSMNDDLGYDGYDDPAWYNSTKSNFKIHAEGLKSLLDWIRKEYDNPRVIITENGYPSDEVMNDVERVDYINEHLGEIKRAIDEGCNVGGYMLWTLLDNFEWYYGYSLRFGIHHVDFSDPKRPRRPKMSALVYKRIATTKEVDFDYKPKVEELISHSGCARIHLSLITTLIMFWNLRINS